MACDQPLPRIRSTCADRGDILKTRAARRAKIKTKRATRKAIEARRFQSFRRKQSKHGGWLCGKVPRRWREGEIGTNFNNSIIRQARSLFAPKVVKFLRRIRLPEPCRFLVSSFFPVNQCATRLG